MTEQIPEALTPDVEEMWNDAAREISRLRRRVLKLEVMGDTWAGAPLECMERRCTYYTRFSIDDRRMATTSGLRLNHASYHHAEERFFAAFHAFRAVSGKERVYDAAVALYDAARAVAIDDPFMLQAEREEAAEAFIDDREESP